MLITVYLIIYHHYTTQAQTNEFRYTINMWKKQNKKYIPSLCFGRLHDEDCEQQQQMFCLPSQPVQMRRRVRWRVRAARSTQLWSTWGSATSSPSGWPSCKPPASLQNMPTSFASSSKHVFIVNISHVHSFTRFTCKWFHVDWIQFHPPARRGLLHRTPEKHRPRPPAGLLPRAECKEHRPVKLWRHDRNGWSSLTFLRCFW